MITMCKCFKKQGLMPVFRNVWPKKVLNWSLESSDTHESNVGFVLWSIMYFIGVKLNLWIQVINKVWNVWDEK